VAPVCVSDAALSPKTTTKASETAAAVMVK
jgi:hypothetical protein